MNANYLYFQLILSLVVVHVKTDLPPIKYDSLNVTDLPLDDGTDGWWGDDSWSGSGSGSGYEPFDLEDPYLSYNISYDVPEEEEYPYRADYCEGFVNISGITFFGTYLNIKETNRTYYKLTGNASKDESAFYNDDTQVIDSNLESGWNATIIYIRRSGVIRFFIELVQPVYFPEGDGGLSLTAAKSLAGGNG